MTSKKRRAEIATKIRFAFLVTCGCLIFATADTCPAEDKIDYLKQVKPILAAKCYACHGALKQEAGLRLETRDLMLKGGDSGEVILAGKSGQSLLVQRITANEDERMPPPEGGAQLSAMEIALIKKWIDQGAAAPREEPPGDPREHWAFQIPVRPEIPPAKDARWSLHPIDALLAAGHRQEKLLPVQPAPKRILLRRLYLDLIGLPPTRQEMQAFLKDDSPTAYENIVGDLLQRPQYGERWGRHWMDVWRYTDWYGLGKQLRYSQKHIWRWRDWIVESLNEDKPYNRMIVEMLAGDEVAPTDPDTLRATGFLARQYFIFNRTTWMDNTIEHTSKAFLGLTMNCAKCHDHKYDPITQVDYYRMRAFFEPYQVRLDPVPGETDLDKNGLPRVYDAHPDAPTYLHVRGNAKDPDKSRVISPGVPEVLAFEELNIKPVALPPEAYNPALQSFAIEDHLRLAEQKIKTAAAAAAKARRQLAAAEKAALKTAASKPAASKTSAQDAGAKSSADEAFLKDDFAQANPDVWETGPGEWKYVDGKLLQTKTGASRRFLQSRANHPSDFEARLKFATTGGDKWRSVGLGFDVVDGREKMVYMSGVSPGSKVQFTHQAGAKSVYPAEAKQNRPVKLNTPYELTIALRGQLLNVAIDGKHAFAHLLKVKREMGRIHLVAFDAAVEFDSLEVRRLASDVTLIPAKTPAEKPATPPLTVKAARAALAVATKSLAVAELQPAALRSAHVADVAKETSPQAENLPQLVLAAAVAARKVELAAADGAVASAAAKLIATGGNAKATTENGKKKAAAEISKTRATAEKALKTARANLDKARKALETPGEKYTSLQVSLRAANGLADKMETRRGPFSKVSTGRRTALAAWIANSKNPLTARVAVNHIWMRHFGQPLVESVTDFGMRAKRPPQRDLLDWLAVEFMENNWSMKHVHRLIVSSRAYQLSSSTLGADKATKAADPENQYYWRRKPLRMESQVIRDSMLHLAGVLDATLGGPTIDPKKEDVVYRRSLYFTHSRDDQQPFLAMFDDADILDCYRRGDSVVPQQALALANSKLALTLSRKITARLLKQLGNANDDQFIGAAFESILATEPTDEEITVCRETLESTREVLARKKHPQAALRARENLVHALLNHNDFITIR